MPLAFPESDHVTLENPPLKEVVCQVRFAPILKIIEGIPSAFQDAIRARFPQYQPEQSLRIEQRPGQPMRSAEPTPVTHRFLSREEDCVASLGLDFFALTTLNYAGWNDFSIDLRYIAERALDIYEIPYATRIGLRYINLLNTENTGTQSFYDGVLELLRPEITALLRTDVIQEPFLGLTQIRVRHDEGVLTFRSGITSDDQTSAKSFVLDYDCYVEEETEITADSLLECAERYHTLIYDAFRWSIVDERLEVFNHRREDN